MRIVILKDICSIKCKHDFSGLHLKYRFKNKNRIVLLPLAFMPTKFYASSNSLLRLFCPFGSIWPVHYYRQRAGPARILTKLVFIDWSTSVSQSVNSTEWRQSNGYFVKQNNNKTMFPSLSKKEKKALSSRFQRKKRRSWLLLSLPKAG